MQEEERRRKSQAGTSCLDPCFAELIHLHAHRPHRLDQRPYLLLLTPSASAHAWYFKIITTDHFLSVKEHANEIFSLQTPGPRILIRATAATHAALLLPLSLPLSLSLTLPCSPAILALSFPSAAPSRPLLLSERSAACVHCLHVVSSLISSLSPSPSLISSHSGIRERARVVQRKENAEI